MPGAAKKVAAQKSVVKRPNKPMQMRVTTVLKCGCTVASEKTVNEQGPDIGEERRCESHGDTVVVKYTAISK